MWFPFFVTDSQAVVVGQAGRPRGSHPPAWDKPRPPPLHCVAPECTLAGPGVLLLSPVLSLSNLVPACSMVLPPQRPLLQPPALPERPSCRDRGSGLSRPGTKSCLGYKLAERP